MLSEVIVTVNNIPDWKLSMYNARCMKKAKRLTVNQYLEVLATLIIKYKGKCNVSRHTELIRAMSRCQDSRDAARWAGRVISARRFRVENRCLA